MRIQEVPSDTLLSNQEKIFKKKLMRVTTVPVSLNILLKGQHRFFNQYFEVVGLASPGKELDEVALSEEIRVVPIHMHRQISLLNDVISLIRIFCVIKKEKPVIIHTHSPKAGTLGMIAAWVARVPVRLHTVAGLPLLEEKGFKRSILDLVEKITYRFATKVYPNSMGLYKIILQNGYAKETKLKVIGNGSSNGIDINHFNPTLFNSEIKEGLRNELQISDQDLVFVFVGRLVKDKGINELIVAFEKLEHQNIKLLLVGNTEPELDPLLPSTKKSINNNSNIISVGFRQDVRPYLAISDVLVFPSYREGFPNVVMQAGAMGLPSIVTDINGCNEIILNGLNGIIIPPKDDKALTKAMDQFIENPELVKQLSQNARESIVSRFDQQTMWNLIKEEYDKQLAAAGII